MNAKQIYTMLQNIQADFYGMGRKAYEQDTIVLDTIMRLYYVTDWMDWEECKYLTTYYFQNGILDFPGAKKMAMQRLPKKVRWEF